MDCKQQTPQNWCHLRHGDTKYSRAQPKTKDATMRPKQRKKETIHGGFSTKNIRRFKVRGTVLRSPAVHLATPEQKETATIPGRPPKRKIRRFRVRKTVQHLSPHLHHEQERPPWTRNYPKILWRIGRLLKPEYTEYCNNLHALHQKYLRGKIDLDDLQDTNRFFTAATNNNRPCKTLNSTPPYQIEADPAPWAVPTLVHVQNWGI